MPGLKWWTAEGDFMLRRKTAWIVLGLVMAASSFGCSVNKGVSARLYDMQDGTVAQAQFHFTSTPHWRIELRLASGEVLVGEYNTITGGVSGWGQIYGTLWSSSVRPDEYVGTAIATSDRGTVIECEYITNNSRTNPHGHGACRDNRGRIYKLMF